MSADGTWSASSLLAPAAWVYGAVVAARNRRFDRGVGVVRLNVPVISVGNISVGGTGKSPVVRWIASLLQREGVTPVIAMRGYGAKPGEKSDEQLEHEGLLPGIDVLAQPDRVAALQPYLAQHPEVGCVILDDGFQHRRMARDLDIVLVDALQPRLHDRLLPAGRLREPAANLRRADAVIVTRAERIDDTLARRIEEAHGKRPAAWIRHTWKQLRIYSQGKPEGVLKPVEWLREKWVAVAAGVGNPQALHAQVVAAGVVRPWMIPLRDHHVYEAAWMTQRDAELADFGYHALVTTQKDWVKIRQVIDLRDWVTPIVVPELALDVVGGETDLVEKLRSAINQPRAANTDDHPARKT